MVWRGQVRHGVAGRVRLGAVRIDAEWMGKQGPDGRGTARLRTDRNGRLGRQGGVRRVQAR